MSQQEINAVVQLLRTGPLSFEDDPAVIRPILEETLGAMPVGEGVTFEEVLLGRIPAVLSTGPGDTGTGTVLYLHGGAYVAGSPAGYRAFWSNIAEAAGTRGVAPRYRLAPEHPFPAAVEDAVDAYRGLLEQGTDPTTVALVGDSAGGGLALAALVAARNAGLPMPAAAVLFSPWTDLGCARDSMSSRDTQDPSLTPLGLRRCAAAYLASTAPTAPLASPVHADLRGLPPTLIQVGTAEVLLDDATAVAVRAAECDVRVTLDVWPGMFHDFPAFGFAISECREALAQVGAFIAGHLAR
jgi:acetyl esterase/lipase